MELKKLQVLHEKLRKDYKDYISMIAVGSIAVGDYWIEGRSDRDILLIFNGQNFTIPFFKKMRRNLEAKAGFDKTYKFVPLPKHILIGPKYNAFDFSNKYRSKTIFGEDLIPQVKLPNKKIIKEMFEEGLEKTRDKMEKSINKSRYYSQEIAQRKFWKLYKHTFMYLAIKNYYQTGFYPETRFKIAQEINSPILFETLQTLNQINKKQKQEIIHNSKNLLEFIST